MLRLFSQGRHVSSSANLICVSQRLLHRSSPYLSSALEEVKQRERSLQPEPRRAKMKMSPYVKNLFRGLVDPFVFGYLELDQGSLNIAEDMKSEIHKFLESEDLSVLNSGGRISDETIAKLKELGVFKLNIAQQYGGLELTCAEMLKLCEEFSKVPSLFQTLSTHFQYISPLFSNFASHEQKEKYLPALASGDLHIGFALWEEGAGVDVSSIQCRAEFLGDNYILSGTKQWVCNAGIADKYVVFASDGDASNIGTPNAKVTCFIVDKNAEGISAKSMETLGMNGYSAWEVTFDKTVVSKDNLIGLPGEGLKILKTLLYGKFSLAGANIGLLRDLLNTTLHHSIKKETFGKPLVANDIVQQHLAEAAARLYALESITYMTADFYDNIEDPDIEAEVGIVKIYSSESMKYIAERCLKILGSDCYLTNKPYERVLRDMLFTPLVDTSVDTLRMTVALLGLKHAGSSFQEEVLHNRNPLLHPKKVMRGLFKSYVSWDREPDIDHLIFENVHPTLVNSADTLEKAIFDFGKITEETLVKWGAELDSRQMNLARLADVATNLYVCTAVLARTSRAISIGLRSCDIDGFMATSLVAEITQSIADLKDALQSSPYGNNDANYTNITKAMIHEKKFTAAHPLSRNY
ncbi:complex I assembly factor ACAD9, mitochondrial-like [Thrips palmi]|uniref:Complex I assembly factor ACAD9, mitochondrial-like n=1 Tax=Thrips palmi TaxID=161013 RepID=A0A6P8ZUB9_THRPL|nr:complex I assembly factor ACAD9, mitochondrial-like [Thrips palmi]